MTDTARSYADLQTLLADNITGEISPQDLRDMLASLKPARGSMRFLDAAPVPTTPVVAGTPLKAQGRTEAGSLDGFSMPADNRLQYEGGPARAVTAVAFLTASAAEDGQDAAFYISRYDAAAGRDQVIAASKINLALGQARAVAPLAAECVMETGDALEVWLANVSSTGAVSVRHGHVIVTGHIR